MSHDYENSSGPRQPARAAALPPIARRKLSHEVLDRLLPRIRAGEFPVGALLPSERELMQTLGVGRPAVREALQTLERMGLVSIVHGEGARVQALTADSVIDQISGSALHLLAGSSDLLEQLKEARLQFEVFVARQAAARATPQQIEALRVLLDAHRASLNDHERFLETDMAFHRGIAAMTGNQIYMAVSQGMLQWLEQFHYEAVRAPGVEKTTLDEHIRLFECIAAGDADGAAQTLIAHLKRANHKYAVPPDPAPAAPVAARRTP